MGWGPYCRVWYGDIGHHTLVCHMGVGHVAGCRPATDALSSWFVSEVYPGSSDYRPPW